MRNYICLAILCCQVSLFAQTSSPKEFLGYELGDRFTFHHEVVNYFNHVAENEAGVSLTSYAETNENRPLMVAFISSPDNIKNLENIRTDNLKRAGLIDGEPTTNIPIVWLSYNVHGNEANSTEASMATLYWMISNTDAKSWLEDMVVVIDPCINPDGRDRYATWYRQKGHLVPNPNIESSEHHEPWPGGRTNHYFYDLNRDWAWQTQVESKGRMALYNKWLPQVHVDFHEMFRNTPYYFAPAAEPYHEVITQWQRDFQVTIGKNHARYFDDKGWQYYTKEDFDLFYPSYGDSYPTFNGAIGMTYEQAGHGRAGLAVVTENGDTLRLSDRLAHHTTTGISTVEASYQNRERLLNEFETYFQKSETSPMGPYFSFIIKGKEKDKLRMTMELLDGIGIEYSKVESGRRLSGFHYQSNRERSFQTEEGDLLVSMYQPKSNFVKVLFEPEAKLKDSLTYDITAWAIPYGYDLDAYAVKTQVNSSSKYTLENKTQELKDNPYAYVLSWQSLKDAGFLAEILKKGIKVRYAEKAFTVEGKSFQPGSLIITKGENSRMENFGNKVRESAEKWQRDLKSVSTGFVDRGKDFGSRSVQFIKKPRVGVISGEQTRSYDYGQIWYFMEQELDYPFDALGTDYLDEIDLEKYDVLIVPNGTYKLFSEEKLKEFHGWVKSGGKLILIQGAMGNFAGKEGFGLKEIVKTEKKDLTKKYENKDSDEISDMNTGSIFRVELDNSHPLAFGYPKYYFTLKNNSLTYPMLEDGWNVGYIASSSSKLSGFAGQKFLARVNNTLVFGVEEIGEGKVVYMTDNLLFRSFWNNGKLFMANAIFFKL